MTKFENRGCELQYAARDISEANKNFAYSCRVCCERGIRLDCDRCAIRSSYEILVAYFATRESEQKQKGRWKLSVTG